ncbi:BnaCnng26630D [Brassica napus]|uniref:(rape) hypothetical protein n=1 Tax=Brassica napus TaxID=3708 RepID=A0A078ISZ5_BRANA|nr:uncharacterized protein LOC106449134 [Brassica napus]CAF2056261.1 unnamed protein product [Brassica napus]CDY54265.1 BnaCnng26630D [Brassica napus]
MASAGVSPAGYSLYGRMSLRREERGSENQDPAVDFEFCPEDPVTMLSADELFSDGKLVPLKFSGPAETRRRPQTSTVKTTTAAERTQSPEVRRRLEVEISELFSPRAPRCTSRWRELLGLKKAHESVSASSSPNPKTSSFKQFLHRGSKSSSPADATPLLMKESDMTSSRLSLSSSSSSSGHEIDDLPRQSLDLEKPSPNPFAPPSRIRLAKPRRPSNPTVDGVVNVTADSPRLNSSGKIVFHGLERSSSSPGCFTGGPRLKQHHRMPRSYSANVRITPVLNVPVSSLKSSLFFGQMFSSSSSSQYLQSYGKNHTTRTRVEF